MKKTLLAMCVAAVLVPATGMAHKAGDFIVRGGVASVIPNESSDKVLNTGKEFKLNNNAQLGLTLGYMITDNIGVELLAATPFSHKVSLDGIGQIAKIKHLPPSLMAQYYLGDANSKLRGYFGAGVNYTTFFSEKFTNDLNGTLSDIKLTDSWGVAVQAGFDFIFDNNVIFNGSIWWMDIDSDVKFDAGGVKQKVKTDIDPVVLMFSIGYSF